MSTHNSADVVIVGAGIIGLSSAYFLAKNGLDVTIIEKDSIGSHASGFAYGSLSPLGEAGLSKEIISELSIGRLGMSLHKQLAIDLPNLTGIDTEYRIRPSMDLSFADHEAEEAQLNMQWQEKEDGYKVRWLKRDEVFKLIPIVSNHIRGAVYTEGVADVEPYKLVLGLTQACEDMGVMIKHGCVTNVDTGPEGVRKISTRTEDIFCKYVILAMGPWATNSSSWLGMNVPIRPLKGQILRLKAAIAPINCSIGWNGNYACSKPDGLIWTGTTEEEDGFDENPTSAGRDAIMKSLIKMLPSLGDARLVQQTACLRPISPDGRMILGEIPDIKGILIGTGTGRKGILLGPAVGYILSSIICTRIPPVNIDHFSIGRFRS